MSSYWLAACEAPSPGGGSHLSDEELCDGTGCGPATVSVLDELLKRHCDRLGKFVEGRLAEYHKELVEQLSEGSDAEGPIRSASKKSNAQSQELRVLGTSLETLPEASNELADYASYLSHRDPDAAAPATSSESVRPHDSEAYASKADDSHQLMFSSYSFDEMELARRKRSKQASTTQSLSSLSHHRRRRRRSQVRSWQEDLRRLVEAPWFEAIICVLITSNVVFLGVEVEMTVPSGSVPDWLRIAEFAYTICFAQELLMRFLAYGMLTFCFKEGRLWNLIDMSVVFITTAELVVELAMEGAEDSFGYARVMRVLRTVRVFRVVRIMKFFRPLRILVYSVLNTMRSLMWTLVLLAIIIYSIGIVFTMAATGAIGNLTDLAGDELVQGQALETNFGSLWGSISTLFLSITGGMDWEKNTAALGVLNPMWVVLFMAYIAFSHLAFVNVVTGVVCQGAIESAQQDQEVQAQSQMAQKQKYVKELEELFKDIDTDKSGNITLQEFEEKLQDERLQEYFAAMNLTADEAWNLFKLLDSSETCLIDIEDFVSGCMRLRGMARSVDVHMLMYESKWTMKKLSAMMKSVEDICAELSKNKRGSQNSQRRQSMQSSMASLPGRQITDESVRPSLLSGACV